MGVVIKVGLFTGLTNAVNANGLFDYFGYTVNMAAVFSSKAKAAIL
ncbi:hypothetical protein RRU94_24730 [Domibacillus sp. DTU_2020_1001157_1_SI_ALB_TIR_016]|nr:hypothetical protein [Domibacillus sp. DTU_2020_1001157_1_SI_ALB_TIR_016]WNS80632.1 hypothetical protein RRU94_24730 [Domibacillus sp. DTU_2020_1001157_1_SI_ALB_TIR_016]